MPTYELHATNEDGRPLPSVTLHYRARISQSTGEDWNNTALTLSTVSSDTVAKQIPQLLLLKIKPQINLFRGSKGPSFNNNNSSASHSLFSNIQGNTNAVFGSTGGGNPVQQISVVPFQSGSMFGAARTSTQPTAQSTPFGLFGQSQALAQNNQQGVQTGQEPAAFGSGLFGAAALPPDAAASREDSDPDQFEEIELPNTISEPTTVVTETPMAISFSVHGESTIPSDGVYHRVSVAVLPFEAKISYVSIPRIEPQIYLQVSCKTICSPDFVIDEVYSAKSKIRVTTDYCLVRSASS